MTVQHDGHSRGMHALWLNIQHLVTSAGSDGKVKGKCRQNKPVDLVPNRVRLASQGEKGQIVPRGQEIVIAKETGTGHCRAVVGQVQFEVRQARTRRFLAEQIAHHVSGLEKVALRLIEVKGTGAETHVAQFLSPGYGSLLIRRAALQVREYDLQFGPLSQRRRPLPAGSLAGGVRWFWNALQS